MRLENFEHRGRSSLSQLAETAQEQSNTLLESAGKRFVFPVHEKILKLDSSGEGPDKQALLRATMRAIKTGWEEGIQPRIGAIRAKGVEELKGGIDFVTEADKASEGCIVREFERAFPGQLQFFGEEANAYTGNRESALTVRIDPIDGTEAFKFGKQDWGMMVGIYQGPHEHASQIVSSIYFPEMNTMMYYIDGVGTFISDVDSGEQKEISTTETQDVIGNVIISYYRHSDISERSENEKIIAALDAEGGRIKFTDSVCGDVLEALLTKGQRIFVYDGDMSQVDYIPFKMLQQAGYKIYPWLSDEEIRSEDPSLKNKRVVIVPPGIAGEKVRALIKDIHTQTYNEGP